MMKNKHIFNVVETLYESIQQKFQRELNPEHLYSIIWNKMSFIMTHFIWMVPVGGM